MTDAAAAGLDESAGASDPHSARWQHERIAGEVRMKLVPETAESMAESTKSMAESAVESSAVECGAR